MFLPVATESQITSSNVSRIRWKILAERANGPTTATVDEVLENYGVFVIQDILTNAGGVTCSYLSECRIEWGISGKGQRTVA